MSLYRMRGCWRGGIYDEPAFPFTVTVPTIRPRKMAANERDKKVDATLAPNVVRDGMDFRRDTGVYSSDGLSTPVDFE